MFKLTFFAVLFALFALLVVADDYGCEEACSYDSTIRGRCQYTCTDVEGARASSTRKTFYEALKEINESCEIKGTKISCKNTPEFGECEQHLWNVGKGC